MKANKDNTAPLTDRRIYDIDCNQMTIWLGIPCCLITHLDVNYEMCKNCKWNRTEKKDA